MMNQYIIYTCCDTGKKPVSLHVGTQMTVSDAMATYSFCHRSHLSTTCRIDISDMIIIYLNWEAPENVTSFPVREHSVHGCYLGFAVHCGIFFLGSTLSQIGRILRLRGFCVWILKMADSVISALTNQLGSWLRHTLKCWQECTLTSAHAPFSRTLSQAGL